MRVVKYICLTKFREHVVSKVGPGFIILSEVSQTEKDKYHMISHMWDIKK